MMESIYRQLREIKEKYKKLQTKYDNVERELLRRDKQYKKLLERVNKND